MADELVSIRGLVDSDFDNPLRKFSGVFDSYRKFPATGYAGMRIDLNFKDLDNVVSVSPYNFPTAVINLGESNKNKSRFGYFAASLAKLLSPDEDLKDVTGRTVTLVFCDGQDGRPAPKPIWNKDADPGEYPDKIVPTPVWIVESIDGVSAGGEVTGSVISIADYALENLIGKTRAQFNKWAFSDPGIRRDAAFQRSISDKSFINALLKLGKIVEDENEIFQLPS